MASNSDVEQFACTAQGIGILGDTKVQITGTDWNLQLDEPEEEGGTNKGANPMQWVTPGAHLPCTCVSLVPGCGPTT